MMHKQSTERFDLKKHEVNLKERVRYPNEKPKYKWDPNYCKPKADKIVPDFSKM